MLRVFITGILATANTLFNRDENSSNESSRRSKWHLFRNFILSTMSSIGIPLFQGIVENDSLYEYVNASLAYTTPNRNSIDHHQRQNSSLNSLSRPNFRRKPRHKSGAIRIIRPTINIHIHRT